MLRAKLKGPTGAFGPAQKRGLLNGESTKEERLLVSLLSSSVHRSRVYLQMMGPGRSGVP